MEDSWSLRPIESTEQGSHRLEETEVASMGLYEVLCMYVMYACELGDFAGHLTVRMGKSLSPLALCPKVVQQDLEVE